MAEQLAELNKGDLEVYSTDEKQIGVWIDGKKIYRRVFSIPAISGSGTGEIATILGITPIRFSGYANASGTILPLDYSGRNVQNNVLVDMVGVAYTSAGKLMIFTGTNRVVTNGYLILDYIKS